MCCEMAGYYEQSPSSQTYELVLGNSYYELSIVEGSTLRTMKYE